MSDAPEEHISRFYLLAASPIVGYECRAENEKFFDCKAKNDNPEACAKEAERVYKCGFDKLVQVNEKLGGKYANVANCYRDEYHFRNCRKLNDEFLEEISKLEGVDYMAEAEKRAGGYDSY